MRMPGNSLRRLAADGELPLSACSAALLRWLQPLLATGVLARVRSGAGERLTVRQPPVLHAYILQRFPGGLDAPPPASRAEAVLNWRDSRLAAPDAPAVVLLRGLPGTRVSTPTREVDLARETDRHGAFALAVEDLEGHRLHGTVAVIENREPFFAVEKLALRGLPARSFVYAAGRLDQRVRSWLAAQTVLDPEPIELLHAGDYDATGLCEFLCLRAAGARARLYLPEDVEILLARHGKPALRISSPELERLQAQFQDPDVARLRDAMARHGSGLEQEALLGVSEGD